MIYTGATETAYWNDLPTELMETILGQVPLLRLAQLARFSKELKAAYDERLAVEVANVTPDWMEGLTVVPTPRDSADALAEEQRVRSQAPGEERTVEEKWVMRGAQGFHRVSPRCNFCGISNIKVTRKSSSPSCPVHLVCNFDCTLTDPFTDRIMQSRAVVTCQVVVEGDSRSMVCESLDLMCFSSKYTRGNEADPIQCPVVFLEMFRGMAPHLRRFLDDIARGTESEGIQGERKGPIQRVTLLLPPRSPVIDDKVFAPALTCVLASVKGKASAFRIAYLVGDLRPERKWRLPYSLHSH